MTEERELCIKGTSLNATHGPHEDRSITLKTHLDEPSSHILNTYVYVSYTSVQCSNCFIFLRLIEMLETSGS